MRQTRWPPAGEEPRRLVHQQRVRRFFDRVGMALFALSAVLLVAAAIVAAL